MATCLDCHDGRRASARCTTCHLATPDDRLVTKFLSGDLKPSGTLRGDRHDADFARSHRAAARANGRYCESCHRESDCASCHSGIAKPMSIHSNDFLLLHASAARKNQPDCQSCHRDQSFCVSCHMRTGFASESARWSALNGASRFHPDGWASTRSSARHHSYQAQRNLRACTSCHQQSTCMKCHATAERGATAFFRSPHPPGFRSACAVRARNKRVCEKCHTGSGLDQLCR